jgi:hypothetical protein
MENKNWARGFINDYEKRKLEQDEMYRNENYKRNTIKKEV